MANRRCSVADCENSVKNGKVSKPKLKFHSFPKSPPILKSWIAKCKRKDKFSVKNCVVCSEHFLENDYERDLKNELLGLPVKRKLKPTAIPSNFPGRRLKTPSNAQLERRARLEIRNRKEIVDNILKAHSENGHAETGDWSAPAVKQEDDIDERICVITSVKGAEDPPVEPNSSVDLTNLSKAQDNNYHIVVGVQPVDIMNQQYSCCKKTKLRMDLIYQHRLMEMEKVVQRQREEILKLYEKIDALKSEKYRLKEKLGSRKGMKNMKTLSKIGKPSSITFAQPSSA